MSSDDFTDVPVPVPAAFWEALDRNQLARAGEILQESVEFLDARQLPATEVGRRLSHYCESDRGTVSDPKILKVEIGPKKPGSPTLGGTALLSFDEFACGACCVREQEIPHREALAVQIDPGARTVGLRMQEWRIRFSEE